MTQLRHCAATAPGLRRTRREREKGTAVVLRRFLSPYKGRRSSRPASLEDSKQATAPVLRHRLAHGVKAAKTAKLDDQP